MLAAPVAVMAQDAAKVRRIGYLSLLSERAEQSTRWIATFREELRERGHIDGQNLVVEQRYAAGNVDRLPTLARELLDLNVAVLVAAPAGSARAAKRITNTVPIVFMGEPDPVGIQLVASLARPGGNVTGLADAHADLIPKRLQLLKQVTPPGTRIGVLRNAANPSTASQLQTAQAAGRALGLTLVPIDVKGPARGDIDQAFTAIGEARLGGLLVIADPTLGNHRTRIAELSITRRLPTSGTHRGWAEGGLLMSYGSDFITMFRRGAALVDKILRGAKPADLPVEEPTKFEFVVNLKTARALDLTMPASLLARADQVLE
ncbi:MAG TPA: ABC transporter substrate-binding protein [Burkholderiales bacterium]|nr:ABC transporter substrate-binding protein [Burkholderiales bacterium]